MNEPLRVLLCACAELPGPSAIGVRLDQFSRALEGAAEVDALCLKAEGVAHIERVRGTRLLRVPTPAGDTGQALDAYRRALRRQLAADAYDLIVAGDLTSAAAIVEESARGGARLVIDLAEAEWTTLVAENSRTRSAQGALREADLVFAQSRALAKLLITHMDPRRVELLERAVDLKVFLPEELLPRKRPRVTIFGGQEQPARWPEVLQLADALGRSLPDARIELLGAPREGSEDLDQQLAQLTLSTRVRCQQTHSPLETARHLARADVVITPVFTSSPVSPSALPHRALEALATGRPLIVARLALAATPVAGTAPAGYLEVPFVPDTVIRATVSLLSDRCHADDLAIAGRELVCAGASLEAWLVRLREVLGSCTGREISPRGIPEGLPQDSWTHGTHAPLRLPPPPITGRSGAGEPDLSHVVVRAVVPSTSLPTEDRVTTTHHAAADDPIDARTAHSLATDEPSLDASSAVSTAPVPKSAQAGTTEQRPVVAPLPRTVQLENTAAPTEPADDWAGETTADNEPSTLAVISPHRVSPVYASLDEQRSETPGGRPEGADAFDPWRHDTIADASPIFVSDERDAPNPAAAPRGLRGDDEGPRGTSETNDD